MRFLVVSLLILMNLACGTGCSKTGGTSHAKLESIAQVYEQGDAETAAEQLQEYLKSYPRDDIAWTILGNAQEDLEHDDQAETAYLKAIEINPMRFEAINGMGVLCRKKREYDRALSYYKQAIGIDPKYATAYASMVVIFIKQKNYKEALIHTETAYGFDKLDPGVVANFAVACHLNGMLDRRDQLTKEAERLGYKNLEGLKLIYSGEATFDD